MYQMANRHRSFQLQSLQRKVFFTQHCLCVVIRLFIKTPPFFCSVIDHSGPPRKRAPCRRLIPSVFMVTNCSFSGCSALCLNYLLPLSSNGHLASIVDLHLQRDSMTSRRPRCVACFGDFPSLFLLLTLWWIWHRLRVKLLLFLPQWHFRFGSEQSSYQNPPSRRLQTRFLWAMVKRYLILQRHEPFLLLPF